MLAKETRTIQRRPRKNSRGILDQSQCSKTLTAPAMAVRNRLPNIDPNVTAEEFLEQIQLGSNGFRVETLLAQE